MYTRSTRINERIFSFLWLGLLWVPTALLGQGRQDRAPLQAIPAVDGALTLPSWEEEVRIDGVLDEGGWEAAARVALPYEVDPADNGPAAVETVCRIAHDAEALFVGCEAHDPDPAAIRAYVSDRDDLAGQDRIALVLDPFAAGRRGVEFVVSPLGVQADAVVSAAPAGMGGGRMARDASWDAIWSSAGRITRTGYTVELRIPFKSLRFPPGAGLQTWRYYIARHHPRDAAVEMRTVAWDRSDACELCQASGIAGFAGIEAGAHMQLTPSLTGGRTDERSEASGDLTSGPLARDVGLDALWAVSPNLVVAGTINPDFSQVEADAPQLTANTRFALFFPERRPFFLEGAELFSTPLRAVFTRSVADPVAGARVTGRFGRTGLGLLLAEDVQTTLLFPGPDGSEQTALAQRSRTAVARWRRDVGSAGAVGALVTGRTGEAYHNAVSGLDAVLNPRPSLSLRVQALRSHTAYPDSVSTAFVQPQGGFAGNAVAATLLWNTREWAADAQVRHYGSGFRADAGFQPQSALRQTWGSIARTFWGEGTWWTSMRAEAGFWRWDRLEPADFLEDGLWAVFRVQGPLQSEVWVNPNRRRQAFAGRTYQLHEVWFGGTVEPWAGVQLSGFNVVGGQVDFANGREATVVELNPSVRLRLGRRTDVGVSHSTRRLRTRAGQPIVSAQVSQLRAVYNFDARTFLRVILQHRHTERDPSLFQDPVDRTERALASQVLLSYRLGPQTVLFLGYSDGRFAETTAELERTPLTLRTRSLFAKASWAWRP